MAICSLVPPGTIRNFGGSLPTGHLLCDGSSYLVATYPGLFAVIGYTWGGSGASFNVPDMRGKTGVGSGQDSSRGLSARTLAQYVGEEGHALTTAELASHSHSITDPGHAHALDYQVGAPFNTGSSSAYFTAGTNNNTASNQVSLAGYSVQTVGTGITATNGAGSGTAHNNMQPSLVVTCCIKY